MAFLRESMAVEGIPEFEIPELSIPVPDSDSEALIATEGGRLFVERAVEARPDFELTTRRSQTISRILNKAPARPGAIQGWADQLSKKRLGAILQSVSKEVNKVAQF